jgi:DNA polymerase
LIKKNFAITRERGRFFPPEYARTIMATLHPAYILRQMNISGDGGYSLLVDDIKKAWDAATRLREMVAAQPEPSVS